MHRRTSPKVVANTNTRMVLTPGQSHGAPRGRARLALILARLVAKSRDARGETIGAVEGNGGGSAGAAVNRLHRKPDTQRGKKREKKTRVNGILLKIHL